MRLTLTQIFLLAYTNIAIAQSPYGQCGGTGFSGSTSCPSGWECLCQNPWYSQCLPAGTPITSSCSGGSGSGGSGSGGSGSGGSGSGGSGSGGSGAEVSPSQAVTSPSPAAGGPGSGSYDSGSSGGGSTTPPASGGSQATTTHYTIDAQTACGCNGAWLSNAGPGIYAAAGALSLFGTGRVSPTYCGSGCGSCFQLTSTGASPPGEGGSGQPTNSIIVLLVDLCPADGNVQWCNQPTNQYGFGSHFDIVNPPSGWNNPIVDYEPIACPATLTSDFNSGCKCANGGQ